MPRRLICPNPNHKEKTPSFVEHPSGKYFKCFGCGYKEWSANATEGERKEEIYKEDLEEAIHYIQGLNTQEVRGLSLPTASEGYYIVWPGNTYFKLRRHSEENAAKYRCPAGHPKPLFAYQTRDSKVLWIVEGEINATSLRLVCTDDIVSPGGCSEFGRDTYLTQYKGYDKIHLVVDYDKAGVQAVQALKPKLIRFCPDVSTHLLKKDFNEVLVERGRDGLKDEVEMLRRL